MTVAFLDKQCVFLPVVIRSVLVASCPTILRAAFVSGGESGCNCSRPSWELVQCIRILTEKSSRVQLSEKGLNKKVRPYLGGQQGPVAV